MATAPLRDRYGRFISSNSPLNTLFPHATDAKSKTRRKTKTRYTTTPRTRILAILDASGSMMKLERATINGYNEFLHQQQREEPNATLSLTLFDQKISRKFSDRTVNTVPDLTPGSYMPGHAGMTALYDAILDTLDVEESRASGSDRILCMIITDGEENASRRASLSMVQDRISRLIATGRWTFLYIGSNHDVWKAAGALGISRGNTMTFDHTHTGASQAFASTQNATTNYRSSGAAATATFFTDLSGVAPVDVHNQLDALNGQVSVLTVRHECDIRPFVESETGKPYAVGSAFYELTKPEMVQGYKEIMVAEKRSKSIFGGPDVRDVLGIPHGNVKITPGNHGNWNIFVQSTSTNRRLVRGTKVIVKK